MRTALLAGGLAAASLAGGAMAMAPATASFTTAAPVYSGSTVVTTLETYGDRGSDVVSYRHGATLRIALPLTNTGALPVTVTGVDLGGQRLALLSVSVRTPRVAIGAGETSTVTVEAVLGNCRYYHERELVSYDAVRVRYEVLGRSGERIVPLTHPLLVKSPMIVGCPDRKLYRQTDNRTG